MKLKDILFIRDSLALRILALYLSSALLVLFLSFTIIWFYNNYLVIKNWYDLTLAAQNVKNISAPYLRSLSRQKAIQDELLELAQTTGSRIILLDAQNLVLFYTHLDPAAQQVIKQAAILRKSGFKNAILTSSLQDPLNPNITQIIAVQLVDPVNNMVAITYRPVFHFANVPNELIRMVWWTSLLVLLLAVPVLYWMSLNVTKPLRRMEALAQEMAEGNLNVRLEVNSRDEVGRLARSFNRLAAELSRVEQQRLDFIANVSHELRTPLTSIKGFVQGMLDETIPREQHEHYLSRIYSETQRLSYIVGDLLDVAALRSGKLEIKMVPQDLWALCREVVEGVEPLAQNKSIQLVVHLPSGRAQAQIDPCRLSQVLMNLMDNAIKFTPRGGKVSLTGIDAGTEWQVQITDQGPGIAPDEIEHVFERFYRGKSNSTAGSGLGLAIAQLLAEAHGGKITVESQPGKGSSFTLHLPKFNVFLQTV